MHLGVAWQENHRFLEELARLPPVAPRHQQLRELEAHVAVARSRRSRLAQRADGVLALPEPLLERGEALGGVLVVRIPLERLLEDTDGLDVPLEFFVRGGERRDGRRVRRVDPASVLQLVDAVAIASQNDVREAQVRVHVGPVGCRARGLLEGRQGVTEGVRGLGLALQPDEHLRARDPHLGEVRVELQRLAVGSHASHGVALGDACVAQELLRLRVVGTDAHAGDQRLLRSGNVADVERGASELDEGIRVFGLEPGGRLEGVGRLLPRPEAGEGRPQAHLRCEVSRCRRGRRAERTRGVCIAPEESVQPSEGDMRLGERRVESERLLVRLHGFFVLAELARDLGEGLPRADEVRLQADRPLQRAARLVVSLELREREPEALPRRGGGRRKLDRASVGRRRPVERPEAPVDRPEDRGLALAIRVGQRIECLRRIRVASDLRVERSDVAQALGPVGREGERTLVGCDRRRNGPGLPVRLREELPRRSVLAPELDGFLERIPHLRPALALGMRDSELEQRVRVGAFELRRARQLARGVVVAPEPLVDTAQGAVRRGVVLAQPDCPLVGLGRERVLRRPLVQPPEGGVRFGHVRVEGESLCVRIEGLVVLAQRRGGVPQRLLRAGAVGADARAAAQRLMGLVRLAEPGESDAQVHRELGVVRIEIDRLPQVGKRLVSLTDANERGAEARLERGPAGELLDGLPQRDDGLLRSVGRLEQPAQRDVPFGILRVELDGAAIGLDGGLRFPERLAHLAERALPFRRVGPEGHALLDLGETGFLFPVREERPPEPEQHLGALFGDHLRRELLSGGAVGVLLLRALARLERLRVLAEAEQGLRQLDQQHRRDRQPLERGAQRLDRGLVLAVRHESLRVGHVRGDVRRLELQDLPPRLDLLEVLVQRVAGLGEALPGLEVVGLQRDALVEGVLRGRPALDPAVRRAELEEDLRVALAEAGRLREAGRALVESPELQERRAEARVEGRLLRSGLDGLLELVGGFGVLPESIARASERRVRRDQLRVERQRPAEGVGARLPVSELTAGGAEQPPRLRPLRVELDRAEERLLRRLPGARASVGEAQLVREAGVIGLLLRCAGEAVRRVAELLLREQRIAQAPVQARVLREEARRLAVRVRRVRGLLGRLVEARELDEPLPPLGVRRDRLLERAHRLFVATELATCLAERLEGLRLGPDTHAFHERLPGLGVLVRDVVRGAELHQRVRVVGAQLHRFREPLERVVLASEARHRAPDLPVKGRILREAADRLLVGERGLLVLPRRFVEGAELFVPLLVIGVELQSLRGRCDGLLALAQCGARLCEILVRQRIVRTEAQARLQGDTRRLPSLPLDLRDAEGQPRSRVLRFEPDGPLEGVRRLLETMRASLLVRLGVGEAHVGAAEGREHPRLVGECLQSGLEAARRLDVLLQRDVEKAETDVSLGPRRVLSDGGLVGRCGFVGLAGGRACLAESLVGVRVGRTVVRRIAQMLSCVLVPRQQIAGQTQLVERLGLRGRELDGLRERIVRLLQALETAQRVPESRVDAGIVGELPEGGLVRLDGRVVAAQRLVHAGDGHVDVRPARLELDGALVRRQRFAVLAVLRAGAPQELVRLGDGLLQADRVAQRSRRLLPAARARQRAPVLDEEVRPLRRELRRPLVGARRLGPLRDARVAAARLLEGVEVRRLEPGDVVVGAGRGLPAFELYRDAPERRLRVEVVRLERRRLSVGVEAVLEIAERSVGRAELEMRVEVVGLVGDDARIGLDGVLGLAEPLVRRAELEPRVRVVRVDEEARLQQVEELLQFLGLAHEGEDDDNAGNRGCDRRREPGVYLPSVSMGAQFFRPDMTQSCTRDISISRRTRIQPTVASRTTIARAMSGPYRFPRGSGAGGLSEGGGTPPCSRVICRSWSVIRPGTGPSLGAGVRRRVAVQHGVVAAVGVRGALTRSTVGDAAGARARVVHQTQIARPATGIRRSRVELAGVARDELAAVPARPVDVAGDAGRALARPAALVGVSAGLAVARRHAARVLRGRVHRAAEHARNGLGLGRAIVLDAAGAARGAAGNGHAADEALAGPVRIVPPVRVVRRRARPRVAGGQEESEPCHHQPGMHGAYMPRPGRGGEEPVSRPAGRQPNRSSRSSWAGAWASPSVEARRGRPRPSSPHSRSRPSRRPTCPRPSSVRRPWAGRTQGSPRASDPMSSIARCRGFSSNVGDDAEREDLGVPGVLPSLTARQRVALRVDRGAVLRAVDGRICPSPGATVRSGSNTSA